MISFQRPVYVQNSHFVHRLIFLSNDATYLRAQVGPRFSLFFGAASQERCSDAEGYKSIENTAKYLGIEEEEALNIAEQFEI